MPGNEGESRVLRIPVREKKVCFVAISFDGALDVISNAVAAAVSSEGFAFNRTDLTARNPEWHRNVAEGIREAAVVVAVINNDKDNPSRVNANVAYELGIAHALGKQVIIVTDDITSTEKYFRDTSRFAWLQSHENGVFGGRHFTRELQLRLIRADRFINENFRHAIWDDATFQRETPPVPTLPLLDSLDHAFRYGKSVHEIFHELNASHMTALSTSTYDLMYSKDIAISLGEFIKTYDKYSHSYNSKMRSFLDMDEPALLHKAEDAVPAFSNSRLTVLLTFVCTRIKNVKDGLRNITDVRNNAVDQEGRNPDANSKLYAHIKYLQGECNQIVSEADEYLKTLMDVFLPRYREQCRG